jgi:hypothetical protein
MRVGVVLDAWKLPIFERRLAAEHVVYEKSPVLSNDTMALFIETSDPQKIQRIARAANDEAAITKKGSPDAN